MSIEGPPLPTEFSFEGVNQALEYIETQQVTDGVECDVYHFKNDDTKDLGIIRIDPGHKTPFQEVLGGIRTVEGYVSGKGQLVIIRNDGYVGVHEVGQEPDKEFAMKVNIGNQMQWQAAENSSLIAYEICFPPYEEGRFRNIE